MQRIVVVCLLGFGLSLAPSAATADEKPSQKTLAEEAQLLGGKRWISVEPVTLPGGKEEVKGHLLISFKPDKGKPSGRAELGVSILIPGGGTEGLSGGYTFELLEEGRRRTIKLSLPDSTVDDKPLWVVPRVLYYTLDGDKLTVQQPYLRGWEAVQPKAMQFKRDTK